MSKDIQAICRDGHVLVYRIYADDHICVTEQTAELWAMHKMGNILFDESPQSTDTPTIEKFKQDRLGEKVKNINNKITSAYKAYEGKISDMNKKYEALVLETQEEQREEEQKAISESGSASKETLDQIIGGIRDKYSVLEESIAQQKIQTMQILESNHKQSMETLIKNFETTSDVKIIWDAESSRYEAVPGQSI
jgi:bisphosphoglycerate-dependent phosphoglycerate mutase